MKQDFDGRDFVFVLKEFANFHGKKSLIRRSGNVGRRFVSRVRVEERRSRRVPTDFLNIFLFYLFFRPFRFVENGRLERNEREGKANEEKRERERSG